MYFKIFRYQLSKTCPSTVFCIKTDHLRTVLDMKQAIELQTGFLICNQSYSWFHNGVRFEDLPDEFPLSSLELPDDSETAVLLDNK